MMQVHAPASSYVIITGTEAHEGALLTRSRWSADVQNVQSQSHYPADSWYRRMFKSVVRYGGLKHSR